MNRLRFYSFITITLTLIFQIGCASSSTATDEAIAHKPKRDVADGLKSAGELFDRRDENVANLRDAVKILKDTRDSDNRNYEVEWKYAQSNYFLGKRTDNQKERDEAFQAGMEAGLIASRIAPDKPEGHFWYGANLGQQAKLSPVTVGFTKVDNIRQALQKVIEIQPDFQGASAYVGLGEIELTGSLAGGSPEKAVEYLEKAVKLKDDNTYTYLHLGRAYLAVGRDAEAKKQFDHLLNMKPSPGYKFEYDESVAEAKKLLQTRF